MGSPQPSPTPRSAASCAPTASPIWVLTPNFSPVDYVQDKDCLVTPTSAMRQNCIPGQPERDTGTGARAGCRTGRVLSCSRDHGPGLRHSHHCQEAKRGASCGPGLLPAHLPQAAGRTWHLGVSPAPPPGQVPPAAGSPSTRLQASPLLSGGPQSLPAPSPGKPPRAMSQARPYGADRLAPQPCDGP